MAVVVQYCNIRSRCVHQHPRAYLSRESCCSQDALEGLMAAMAQYGDTRSLSATEKPLFIAAAQSAIKVRHHT